MKKKELVGNTSMSDYLVVKKIAIFVSPLMTAALELAMEKV